MFSKLISVLFFAAASLLLAWLVSAQLSALCGIAGSVHDSVILLSQ